jgi:hypothetical protein
MRIAVFIITFGVLLQGFSKSILLIRYHLNKQHYAEVLCTNKGLMVVDCEGTCRLLEEVKEDEERSTNIPVKETIDISSLPPIENFNIRNNRGIRCRIMVHPSCPLLKGCVSSLYKPPRFTSVA